MIVLIHLDQLIVALEIRATTNKEKSNEMDKFFFLQMSRFVE